jgi:hypothetical protein
MPEEIKVKRKISESKLEQREVLYEKVDYKVQKIIELRRLADECKNLPPEEIGKKFESAYQVICQKFDSDTINELLQLEKLQQERDQLFAPQDDEDLSENKKMEQDEFIEAQFHRLNQAIDTLLSDDDVMFLHQVKIFMDTLVKKRKQVLEVQQQYQENKEKFLEFLAATFRFNKEKTELFKQNVSGIDFIGYSVIILINSNAFDALYNTNGAGSYYSRTVFITIKNQEENQSTIQHEIKHNLIESFIPVAKQFYAKNFISSVRNKIEQLKGLQEINAPEGVIDDCKHKLQESVRLYYQSGSNEMIADMDRIAGGNLRAYFFYFTETLDELNTFLGQLEDSEGKDIVTAALTEMKKNFIKSIITLSNIFAVAEEENKIEIAQALLVLFKLEQINKVERQIKRLCPRYDFYRCFQPLLGLYWQNIQLIVEHKSAASQLARIFGKSYSESESNKLLEELEMKTSAANFFTIDNLEQLLKILDKQENLSLTQEERQKIESLLKNNDKCLEISLAALNLSPDLKKVENILALDGLLKKIAEKLNIPELTRFIEEAMSIQFSIRYYDKAIGSDDFSEFAQFYNKWQSGGLSVKGIDDFLLAIVSSEEIYDDYEDREEDGLKYNKKSITQSNFWKFLESIGLDQQAKILLK